MRNLQFIVTEKRITALAVGSGVSSRARNGVPQEGRPRLSLLIVGYLIEQVLREQIHRYLLARTLPNTRICHWRTVSLQAREMDILS